MLLISMKIISVDGIVIKTTDYKEKSKIINILTKEYGILGCMSKGCKSLKSKLRLPSELFAYGTFHLYYKEKGLCTLIDADVKNYFINIKSDINKLSYLTYLTELSSYVYKESENEIVFDLLIDSINKIEDNFDMQVISNILELKFLDMIGLGINVDECCVCGDDKVSTFSLSKGGFVCKNCVTNETIIDYKVLKMLRMYKYVDISKISNIDISSDVSNKINDILDEFISNYSGFNIRSKNFLKNLK